jgi:hypothetical protein
MVLSYRAGGFPAAGSNPARDQGWVRRRSVPDQTPGPSISYRLSGRGRHFRGDAVVVWGRFFDAQVPTDG